MITTHYTLVRRGDAFGPMNVRQLAIWLSARTGKEVLPADAVETARQLNYEIYDGK